jgi:molecular chaperone GrpE
MVGTKLKMQSSKFKINDSKEEEEKKPEENKETKEIEGLKQKIEEIDSKYKRALADYQNLEKRVAEEKREWALIANKILILRILPILDTLMLAVKHSQDQGLKISVSQSLDILKNEGVTRIDTKDRDFDPGLMECIETVTGPKDKVIEETRAGFMLGDTVLRPAQVRVGNGSSK